MTQPCDLPAVTARALIGERKLSPVELLESCIHRIEEIDPAVNAMIARSFVSARATARECEAAVVRGDPLGPLHGLPLGVKDLIDAKGLPTSFGSVLFASNIRNMAWLQISQLGPMARTVSDACLMLSCMLDRDARDPLSAILHAGGAPDSATYRNPPRIDLATLRIAATSDFGFAPTERAIAEAFRKKLATFG